VGVQESGKIQHVKVDRAHLEESFAPIFSSNGPQGVRCEGSE